MTHALEAPFRTAHRLALLLSLGISAGPLSAQPKLEITSPRPGDVAYSGRVLTVEVAASPAGAFQFVTLMGDLAREPGGALTVPPYRFTIRIPPDTASRKYTLTAIAVAGPKQAAKSEPVSIKVERPDSPTQLKATPSALTFHYLGHHGSLLVYGSFADGSEVDLTDSSFLTYASDAPEIATVDDNGEVTAVGPGRAKVNIRYRDKTVQVPLEVLDRKQPESQGR
ncbi:MAG: Ig-like domain-containing protein [Bryobacteraceae bacterium]